MQGERTTPITQDWQSIKVKGINELANGIVKFVSNLTVKVSWRFENLRDFRTFRGKLFNLSHYKTNAIVYIKEIIRFYDGPENRVSLLDMNAFCISFLLAYIESTRVARECLNDRNS